MTDLKSIALAVLLALSLPALSACGQTGDLYLPEPEDTSEDTNGDDDE